jgi:hypothetical protein
MQNRKLFAGIASVVLAGSLGAAGIAGTGAAASSSANAPAASLDAKLRPLNNSGGHGNATVEVAGRRAQVDIDAFHLAKGLPHAQHIHFSKTARNECPDAGDDANLDHRLSTTDGAPAYGRIRQSLTTRGDTSNKSALAVTRFPTAPKGEEHYNRSITFNSAKVARAIRNGKGVIVIHGVDYNGNGEYDFSSGRSDLDPSLPAEATDPAICGVLR